MSYLELLLHFDTPTTIKVNIDNTVNKDNFFIILNF